MLPLGDLVALVIGELLEVGLETLDPVLEQLDRLLCHNPFYLPVSELLVWDHLLVELPEEREVLRGQAASLIVMHAGLCLSELGPLLRL